MRRAGRVWLYCTLDPRPWNLNPYTLVTTAGPAGGAGAGGGGGHVRRAERRRAGARRGHQRRRRAPLRRRARVPHPQADGALVKGVGLNDEGVRIHFGAECIYHSLVASWSGRGLLSPFPGTERARWLLLMVPGPCIVGYRVQSVYSSVPITVAAWQIHPIPYTHHTPHTLQPIHHIPNT